MLSIRSEQMAAFAQARLGDFRRRLRAYLYAESVRGGRTVPDDRLDRQLALVLDRGQRYFRSERDLARYARILILQPGGWDEREHADAVEEMLRPHALDGAIRLDNLERWLSRKAPRDTTGHD